MRNYLPLFVLLLLAPVHWSFGQADSLNANALFDLNLEELLELPVSSAAKVEQTTQQAAANITVIPREAFQRYGWLSLNDALYRQAGFAPSQEFERRTLSSRGLYEGWNNNHYLLLIDGLPMNENSNGTALTNEATPLVFLKSLEVLKGPASALYGNNATNGVLAINTLSAEDLNGNSEASVRLGNMGTYIVDAIAGTSSRRVSAVVAYNYYTTNGIDQLSYDGSYRTDTDGNLLKFRIRDERENHYLFAKLEGKARWAGFSTQYHLQRFRYQIQSSWYNVSPDIPDNIYHQRHLFTFKYQTPASRQSRLRQEYALRFQTQQLHWDTRLVPSGVFGYQYGLSEHLDTRLHDVFLRAQWTYTLPRGSSLVGGVENSTFLYFGDKLHQANINLTGDFTNLPNGEMRDFPDFFGPARNKPANYTGAFGQWISPRWLNDKLQVTVGLRYDQLHYAYSVADSTGAKTDDADLYTSLNPRLAVVYAVSQNQALKLMAGRAFRAPSPLDLFGANTALQVSNLTGLNPETVYNVEAIWEAKIWKNRLATRVSAFFNRYEDFISYSGSQNIVANLFSTDVVGAELDANFRYKAWSAFFNYSFAQRVGEVIKDSTHAPSPNQTTWVPTHRANLGVSYRYRFVQLAVGVSQQGRVLRRSSDLADPFSNTFRPVDVAPWTQLDANLTFFVKDYLQTGLTVFNALNNDQFLAKSGVFPYDYRMEKFRFLVNLQVRF